MSDPVTVTERAAKRIAEIVAGEAAARALRVSVEGGGCSGFQYKFDLVAGRRRRRHDPRARRRQGGHRPGLARLSRRLGDRFRRRSDRRVVPGEQSQGDRLVRLRHQLLALAASAGQTFDSRLPLRRMKVTTWNINGVKARLESAVAYLRQASPDVICLQEIKSVTEAFPASAFEDLGYHCAVHGQKGFNGVAILSKLPLEEMRTGLPGNDADDQSRFIEAVISVPVGHRQGRLDLRAQRQSDHDGEISLQARLARATARALPPAARRGDPVRHGRRLQRHPRADRRQAPRRLDQRCALSAGDARRLPLHPQRRADRRDPPVPSRARASTRSGTIRPAPSRRTTASASITCCCRRRPPIASSPPASIASPAPGKSHRITCRHGSSSTSKRRYSLHLAVTTLPVAGRNTLQSSGPFFLIVTSATSSSRLALSLAGPPSDASRSLAMRRVVRPSNESSSAAQCLVEAGARRGVVAALFENAALQHVRGGKVAVELERAVGVLFGCVDAPLLEGDSGARVTRRGAAATFGKDAVDLVARRRV